MQSDDQRARALAAAQKVAARLSLSFSSGGAGAGFECAGLGCGGSAGLGSSSSGMEPEAAAWAPQPASVPQQLASSFLASLGPPPELPGMPSAGLAGGVMAASVPPSYSRWDRDRSSNASLVPIDAAGAAQTAQQQALAAAMRLAETLSGSAAAAAAGNAPNKTLDELLARDRARIAAADEKNMQYVLEKESGAKARAKAAAAAAAAVAQAQQEEMKPAAAAAGKPAASKGGAHAAACSVYVSGLPRDTSALEVEEHFKVISPVSRVKLYKDAQGNPKGDCLVTFDKDAAVIGACQLLHNKMLRPGITLGVTRAVFGGADAGSGGPVPPPPPPPPPPPTTDLTEIRPSDDALRVVVVRNLFDTEDVPPPSPPEAREAWIDELTDDLWSECCRHGEVERIQVVLPAVAGEAWGVAVRFQSLIAAASAVDALNGRFFAERELVASFDDGSAAGLIPPDADRGRQERFGFGEIAQAYQESMRVLRLAAAEGALFIACASFVCELEFYEYRSGLADPDGAPQGAGYYRLEDAPEPDPLEQSRAILQQACEAGAAFIGCAEPIAELPMYEYRDGPEGLGYYRHAGAPPPADPREQSLMLLREAAAAGAGFVRCLDFVGAVNGYDFREEGEPGADDGTGYYRRDDAPPPDEWEYSRIVLERASAAGAEFVAIPQKIMELPGYEFKEGAEGMGYYLLAQEGDGCSFDDFMSDMKELGAV